MADDAVAVKQLAKGLQEVEAILLKVFDNLVENLFRQTFGVVAGLEQVGRDSGDQHRLADARAAIPGQVTGNLATAHGEAGKRCTAQIERLHQVIQIACQRVVLVTRSGPVAAAETAAVVGDDAVAVLGQHARLAFPTGGGKRPAVNEDDRRAGSPVVVVDRGFIPGLQVRHRSCSSQEWDAAITRLGFPHGGAGRISVDEIAAMFDLVVAGSVASVFISQQKSGPS